MNPLLPILLQTTTQLPMTAWEQAVIVCIFIVAFGGLLTGVWAFLRWVLGWARKLQIELQAGFKTLIIERDKDWQHWMGEQDEKSQNLIGDRMDKFDTKLDAHDANMDKKFDAVNTHIRTTRKKKQGDTKC